MNFELTHTNHPSLKNYLHCCYDGYLKDVSYWAYPNYYLLIVFYKNAEVAFTENELLISASSKQNTCCICVNVYHRPLKVTAVGKVEQFCVAFKPYGLAQFIEEMPVLDSIIPYFKFDLFDDFIQSNPNLLSLNLDDKQDLLERYLESKLSLKSHTEYIVDHINRVLSENTTTVSYPISSKTLYRAFKNICGIPESILFKTVRFRKSLEKINKTHSQEKMFEIAYDLGYYDQAHFNKLFKQLGKSSPKSFFKNITSITQENIYFKIEKK